MGRFVHNAAIALATTLAATFLTFALVHLQPGDDAQVAFLRIFLRDTAAVADADAVATVAAMFGFDRPLWMQFLAWLGDALRGELGVSLRSGRPVLGELLPRAANTAILTAFAIVIALVLTLACARLARIGRVARALTDAWATLSIATPAFYAGIVLLLVFAVELGWLPVSGFSSWRHWVLPALALAIGHVGFTLILLAAALDDVYGQAYIAAARAKGASRARVFWRHALAPSLVPCVPQIALQIAHLAGGALVIERLFAIPGLGAYLLDSIEARDRPALLACVGLIAIGVVTINLATDVLLRWIDPRLREVR